MREYPQKITLKQFLSINEKDVPQYIINENNVIQPQYEVRIWRNNALHYLNVYALYKGGKWYFSRSWSAGNGGGGGYPHEKYDEAHQAKQDIVQYVLGLSIMRYYNKTEILNAIAEARQITLF